MGRLADELSNRGHPDGDAQFGFIGARPLQYKRQAGRRRPWTPRSKDVLGHFRNAGRERRPAGRPVRVRVHDVMDPESGRAIPTASTK